ncbi:MAG TPA: RNA 2',3'-cyclic phosphodiesterase [Candidatus Dojkabacteria bacterium]|nr:RNA 2',3'-cyclic phosphodiesterase [Candidatus Dojkabacteria bacterium]
MRLEKKPQKKVAPSKLFIAFDLPFELKRQLIANNRIFNKDGRNFSFVSVEQLHMTIKFLGPHISTGSKNKIISSLEGVLSGVKPIKLTIESLKFGFPHQTIPRIVFYNISPTKELDHLYKSVGYMLKKLDLPEILTTSFIKKNVYHLTVARLKHQPNRGFGRKIRSLIRDFKFDPIEFEVKDVWLMESKIERNGQPKYTYLHRFSLDR